jgi:hypothetical protein
MIQFSNWETPCLWQGMRPVFGGFRYWGAFLTEGVIVEGTTFPNLEKENALKYNGKAPLS